MKVGEFFVELGIDASKGSSTVKEFSLGLLGLKMSTLTVGKALYETAAFIKNSAVMSSNAAVSFQTFSNATGISAERLQSFQIIAKQANVSAEEAAGGEFNLQMALAALERGAGNIEPFQYLRISPQGNFESILDALRRKAKTTDPTQFTAAISRMGLPSSFANIFKLGDAEFEAFKRTSMGMSEQVKNDTLEMTLAFNQLILKIKEFRYNLGGGTSGFFKNEISYINKNWNTKTLGSGILSGANMLLNPIPGFNMLLHKFTPLGLIYDMFSKGSGKGGGTTNHTSITVYGDTSDGQFAKDVASIIEDTAQQSPIYESQTPRK